jgi:23S rRNA pseudouridine1911/1915/1917 synthase
MYDNIQPGAHFTFIVTENTKQRIDIYLTQHFSHYSRNFFQSFIAHHSVTINGKSITKSSAPVKKDDIISITFPHQQTIEPTTVYDKTKNVTIIAQNEHFLIIHKPADLMVHPPFKTSTAITLSDWILHNHHEIAKVGSIDRPGIVHRLDKDTSGLMIIARTNYAHTSFNELFKKRKIEKKYHALVRGHLSQEGTITLSIGRDPYNRQKMTTFNTVNPQDSFTMMNGIKVRHATTHYKVLQYFEDSTLVELQPITGRTHQLRVHLAAIGHPIIGDSLYGGASLAINRQALHAYSLSFTFDTIPYIFTKDIPEDFKHLISTLRPHL